MNGLGLIVIVLASAFGGYCTAALAFTARDADRRAAEMHARRVYRDRWDDR